MKNFTKQLRETKWLWVLALPFWAYGAFIAVTFAMAFLQVALVWVGVPLDSVNPVLLGTVYAALVYTLAIVIVIGVPYLVRRRKTTRKELGVPDTPSWIDLLLPVPAYIVYVIVSAILMLFIMRLVPGMDLEQTQALPFTQSMLGSQWHYILAFVTLVVLAPVAEELLFRGYLYGKLVKVSPVWVAIVVSSLVFGAAHLWAGGGDLQWAVMIDTFALGIMLALLRVYTGAVWAGILVHALKNGIAFYFLFVNPQAIEQIQSAATALL